MDNTTLSDIELVFQNRLIRFYAGSYFDEQQILHVFSPIFKDDTAVIKKEVEIEGSKALITDRFLCTPQSIQWECTVESDSLCWSAPLKSSFRLKDDQEDCLFWAPWGNGSGPMRDLSLNSGNANGVSANLKTMGWNNPLKPMAFENKLWYYGARYYSDNDPQIGYCPTTDNLVTSPFYCLLKPTSGISVMQSLNDVMLDATLDIQKDGTVTYTRIHHRFGSDNKTPSSISFHADIFSHGPDWRSGLKLAKEMYKEFFEPQNPLAYEVSGGCAYSTNEVDFDVDKMKKMGFKVNWKASYDFPYMGMFIPPVKESTDWPDFKGGHCSINSLRHYSDTMAKNGFCVLNYFNVNEFGAYVKYPYPMPSTTEENRWTNCNDYLRYHLGDAVYLAHCDIPNSWAPQQTFWKNTPIYSWMYCVAMDPGVKSYSDFLVDQAKRHIRCLPSSYGICIDRLDWMRLYNFKRDDGISFVEGEKCSSLLTSWNSIIHKLSDIFHKNNKLIYCNNHSKRIDALKYCDGILDEFTYSAISLNTTAFLCLDMPAMGWVYNTDQILSVGKDQFMTQYLCMGVIPMVPYPGNDHSILPDDEIDQLYLDYGHIFTLLQGRRWVLEENCISSEDADTNMFVLKDGSYMAPVVSFENNSAEVYARLPKQPTSVVALYPGDEKEYPVEYTVLDDSRIQCQVPIHRGCCVLLFR